LRNPDGGHGRKAAGVVASGAVGGDGRKADSTAAAPAADRKALGESEWDGGRLALSFRFLRRNSGWMGPSLPEQSGAREETKSRRGFASARRTYRGFVVSCVVLSARGSPDAEPIGHAWRGR
jgi:hypothetical protein